eukprot:764025-Hanusia_phi.AAC.2
MVMGVRFTASAQVNYAFDKHHPRIQEREKKVESNAGHLYANRSCTRSSNTQHNSPHHFSCLGSCTCRYIGGFPLDHPRFSSEKYPYSPLRSHSLCTESPGPGPRARTRALQNASLKLSNPPAHPG